MKLLRIKIDDAEGFRGIQSGFEHYFRTDQDLQEEKSFAPFICAGRNGSGKSNILEAIAAIFFNVETRYLNFLPESKDSIGEPIALLSSDLSTPDAYELEYQKPVETNTSPIERLAARVLIRKEKDKGPEVIWKNSTDFGYEEGEQFSRADIRRLLPSYLVGYSSGQNEVLSLPFFKMRFVQYDEYWNALRNQQPYPGRPETRLVYMDSSFSQAIFLCNMLFLEGEKLATFRKDVGIAELTEFRIILRRSIEVDASVAASFGEEHPALNTDDESGGHTVNLLSLLEADEGSRRSFDSMVNRLRRCATCSYEDETNDNLCLDYSVNQATRDAFRDNFDGPDGPAIALFQVFQVLLSLNLYSASETLKEELYKSDSDYVSETVPVLASDERIMRFKFVKFSKDGVDKPVMLKNLSDGEHQLMHSLGMCLLFGNTNSLFLLDEPETHFNPDWRSKYVSQLNACLVTDDEAKQREVIITTHSPFIISDSPREKVLWFKKENGEVRIDPSPIKTFGTSVSIITDEIFEKEETLSSIALSKIAEIKSMPMNTPAEILVAKEASRVLGESPEKVLLFRELLLKEEELKKGA